MMISFSLEQQACFPRVYLATIFISFVAYPYLFKYNLYCSAYSAHDLGMKHRDIETFDIIDDSDLIWSRFISTRDTSQQLLRDQNIEDTYSKTQSNYDSEKHAITTPLKKVHFSSLGQNFNLILNKPTLLTTKDITITTIDQEGRETVAPLRNEAVNVLEGHIEGDPSSRAATSYDEDSKLLTAHIKTGLDTIIVEPAYLHRDNLWIDSSNTSSKSNFYDRTMIVYNLRDHRQFKDHSNNETSFDLGSLCQAVNKIDYANYTLPVDTQHIKLDELNPELEDIFKYYEPSSSSRERSRRSIDFFGSEQAKEKTRCTLHLVADYLFYKHVGKGDLQTTINYLLALMNRVNHIYLPTVWETGDDRDYLTNIGFTVQNITIHQEYTKLSSSGEEHYNMQTNEAWKAKDFLDNFSKNSPPRHYCLAHLLTYRQFDSPVLGLAYVASTRYGTIGGICSPAQPGGEHGYIKHNTGISTSKGVNGETLITRQADLVVAHELGHNLGAEHDSNECRPNPTSGGAFLMHPFAVMGFEQNNRFLSNCSRLSIGRVIKRKAPTCFVAVIDHICGNGVVEDDEECDGGHVGHDHNDPCCDSNCRFTPGSQCSDRHSLCCSKCHIVSAGIPCRLAEEYNCKQVSHCDGRSAECPESPPVEDNQSCVGRGFCRAGECTPFCEAKELHSCLCQNPADACRLCCKTSLNGTCVPYDSNSPYLPDGLLCYRGVCEKGRCEQPIQDAIERLWDVIEDINFRTFVKFLRDNIILVILVISIPIWYIVSRYIDEFDNKIKEDLMNAIRANTGARRKPPPSPFLPSLFVGPDGINATTFDEDARAKREFIQPLKPPHSPRIRDPATSNYGDYGWKLETNV